MSYDIEDIYDIADTELDLLTMMNMLHNFPPE